MVWCFGFKSKSKKKNGKPLGPQIFNDEKQGPSPPPSFRSSFSTEKLPPYSPPETPIGPIMICVAKAGTMRTCTADEYRAILKKQKNGMSLISWQNQTLQEQFANIDSGAWSEEKRLRKERELLRKLQETNGERLPMGQKQFRRNFEDDVEGRSLKPRMWFVVDSEELYRQPELTKDDAVSVNSF